MKFKDWSLKTKIIIPIFSFVVLILAASTIVMTEQAKTMAVEQATSAAQTQAKGFGNEISKTLSKALTATRTVASLYQEAANYSSIPDREFLDAVRLNVLKRHPVLAGSWCVFPSKTTFDNKEDEYRAKYKGAYRQWYYRDGANIVEDYAGDPDMSKVSWFTTPMSGNGETITEPYAWKTGGKKSWFCSTGYPITRNGKNIGVIGFDFYLDDLQKTILDIKPFETGYAFLVTNKGNIVAHPEKDIQAKNLSDVMDGKHKKNILEAIKNGQPYSYTGRSPSTGKMEYITFAPVAVGKTVFPWSVALVIPMDKVKAQANTIAFNSAIVGVIAILILLCVLFVLAGVISKPILKTADYTNKVAEGNHNAELDIHQRDEIGTMADSLRSMVSELKINITKAKEETDKAKEESTRAHEATKEAEKARAKADTSRAEGLHHAASRVEQVLHHVVSASEQMSVQSAQLLKGTEIQSERISSTATAMEEMNATVLEIARNAGDAAISSTEAQHKAKDGAEIVSKSRISLDYTVSEVNNLKGNMEELDKQAKGTETIIGVITDIADQTNLLALNAAIEAARAGEAGRGFAVVADEVRKLAEKTMTATGEVSQSIGAIQRVAVDNIKSMEMVYKRIGEANQYSESSGGVLKEIVDGAEASASQIQSIATAAEQQSATSEEISCSVEEISRITTETAAGATEFSLALGALAEQISVMQKIVEDLKM